MSISERAAAEILRPVGMSREQARRLLLTGAAGSGVRGRTTTYDEAAVRALAARPAVDEGRLAADCPWGVHVVRLARGRSLNTSRPCAAQATEVASSRDSR